VLSGVVAIAKETVSLGGCGNAARTNLSGITPSQPQTRTPSGQNTVTDRLDTQQSHFSRLSQVRRLS
jgi:hypothetical protein